MFFLSLVVLTLLSACQNSKKAQESTEAPPDSQAAAMQRGTWTLMALGSPGRPAGVLERTQLTANFDPGAGQLRGQSGCNSFSAPYLLDGDSLQIKSAAATRKLCDQPQGVMQQETLYLRLLETVNTYRVEGEAAEETLYLDCYDGQVLIFGREG